MQDIQVKTSERQYSVKIENQLLRSLASHVREAVPNARKFFLVTVRTVRKFYGKTLAESFATAGMEAHWLEMPEGERFKRLIVVEELATKLVKLGADRSSCVVAIGGGVTGDVAGFLASIYMRGIPVVQVPTTYLAQVDASIGGKTGVNLGEGKNLIGTFHQPHLVVIDPEVLLTLPEREFRAGLFETLKAGVIWNASIFNFMEDKRDLILRRDLEALEWLITESVRVKADVVSQDEHESDLRRILNFGHTIGHALESATNYSHFLHGEAVAWGMLAATMISVGMQKTDSRTAQRIISTTLAYSALPKVEVKPKVILKALQSDKKTVNSKVHFILPTEIGKVVISSDVPDKAVLQAVEELRYLS